MQLVPITPEGTVALSQVGVVPDEALQVVEAARALYRRRGFEVPWICYFAVDDAVLVGSCGFVGPPRSGEAEIAYFTFGGSEGRGMATRMAGELMRLAAPAAGAVRVIAHTLPEEGPSASVLRKLGLRLVGAVAHDEDGMVWKWVGSPARCSCPRR